MDSSLWDEPDFVVKVFLTMMALKDADHIVRLSAYQLSRNARKTEQEVLEALRVLSRPDTRRLEPQEFEGRRIEKVEDGWLILNGQKYRDMVSEERRKARNRQSQANWRARQKLKRNGVPLPNEAAGVAAYERGDEVAAANLAAERVSADPKPLRHEWTEAELVARKVMEALGPPTGPGPS